MRIAVKLRMDGRFADLRRHLASPEGLLKAGCERLAADVQRHVLNLNRHATRAALDARSTTSARATNHYQEGARSIHVETGPGFAAVVVPIPGISRAFRDLTIAPRNKRALAIPINSIAYAQSADTLKAKGWQLFSSPRKPGICFGRRDGEVRALYALKSRVHQRQDRSLLPNDTAIRLALTRGAVDYLKGLGK